MTINLNQPIHVILAGLDGRLATLESPPAPAPSFTGQPSITSDGTPMVGETLTGNDGTIANGTVSLRQWLLNGSAISGATGSSYVPVMAGQHALRVTATGTGGDTVATSTAITVAAAPEEESAKLGRIGQNVLGGHNFYEDVYPFLDRFKTSGDWGFGYTSPVDALGWPTTAAGQESSTLFNLERRSAGQPYRYVAIWTGAATYVNFDDTTTIDAGTPGRKVFDWIGTDDTNQCRVKAGPGKLDSLKVYRLDQEALAGTTYYNPAFVANNDWVSALRLLDYSGANYVQRTTHESRPVLGKRSWAGEVPLEARIALCNELGVDFWDNIPAAYTDAAVTAHGQLVKSLLRADLKHIAEWANETFNYGQYPPGYCQSQAALLGIGSAESGWEYAGYRKYQVANLLSAVYAGADRARLINVFAVHTANTANTVQAEVGIGLAAGASNANGEYTAQAFDAVAMSLYNEGGLYGNSGADLTTIYNKAVAMDIAWGLAQLDSATGLANNGISADSLEENLIPYHAAFATARGLTLMSYEGGEHLDVKAHQSNGFTDPQLATINAYFRALVDTPGNKTIRRRLETAFRAAGGDLNMNYGDIREDGNSGLWGSRRRLYDVGRTGREEELIDFQANPPAPPAIALSMAGSANVETGALTRRTIAMSGGTAPRTVVLTFGSVPGMTFNGKQLVGTPSADGSYPLAFTGTDATGATITLNRTITAAPLALYKYRWMHITDNFGHDVTTLGEWVEYDGGGNVIANTGETYSASGFYPGEGPELAFDADLATAWTCDTGFPHWLAKTRATPNRPVTAGFRQRNGLGGRMPIMFQVRASNTLADVGSSTAGVQILSVNQPGVNITSQDFTYSYP